ncbi:expansin-like A1 [Phalaenopsis equestris]|uniref:expansin-like A1 n=1 Tax=Phalaenopsis equestris TaxID=78828 RepID=UPI0009E2880D|nr:expansin-like A1 [Phalaenopsis equestris]
MKLSTFFLLFPIFLSLATACDRCVHKSKVAVFSPPSSLPAGACGYGSLALNFSHGLIAAASSKIYRDGVGCGGCFQIRCRNTELCNGAGVKVVVTDLDKSNRTDFRLSSRAFAAMARPGMVAGLQTVGVVDAEHKRIPCDYSNKNLSIRVEESSRRPSLLTVKLIYQGGQTDVVAVDVARFGSPAWQFMTRLNGPVWTTRQAPGGPLQFRFVVTGGYDGKWVWAQQEVLPAEWRSGEVYDTGVQITDIAQEGCSPCDTEEWR